MIVGDGAGFDYSVDVLVNLDLDIVEFLRRFQYGLYVIIFIRYCYLNLCFLTHSTMKKSPPNQVGCCGKLPLLLLPP